MPTLIANNLSKSYKGRQVVKNVSIKISSGEIVGLLGPNGAGKTTSFYMIVGLVANEGGQILLDNDDRPLAEPASAKKGEEPTERRTGVYTRVHEDASTGATKPFEAEVGLCKRSNDITHLAMHERAQQGIGYLPQEASVFRKLTVADNIMAILQLRKTLTKEERLRILDELLNEFHINHIRDSLGISLSGGERRRLEIARALAAEPKFILLDEPFAGVDPISVIDIKRIITHLGARGIGVLITDHNVRETLDICERAYIVNAGQIICDGTPTEILQNKQVREVYLGEEFAL